VQACGNSANQNFAVVCLDGSGGAYVAWEDRRNIPTLREDVYAQHITASGNIDPNWPVDGLGVAVLPEGQGGAAIIADGLGGVVISWGDLRNPPHEFPDIFGVRLDASGALYPGWEPNGSLLVPQRGTRGLYSDGGQGFYLPNITAMDFFDRQYYVHRFTMDGELAPGWPEEGLQFCNAPGDRTDLNAAEDGMGGLVFAWFDYRTPEFGSDVYASHILPNGTLAPGIPSDGLLVSDPLVGIETLVDVETDGAGGMFVVWEWYDGFHTKSRLQHMAAGGGVALGWPPYGFVVSTSEGDQLDPALATDGMGGVYVVWNENRPGRNGLYARRFQMDGPVATRPSLVSAEAGEGIVTLVWYAKGASGFDAIIERRTEHGPWEQLGVPGADGADGLRYEDRTVTAGERYAYRLGYAEGGAQQFTEETWVEVPSALRFALDGFAPNPAIGTPSVSLTLPQAEEARLEVFDLRGRLVTRRDLSSLGPGRHVVPLDMGTSLASGVYLIRLTQGPLVAQARGVVLD
jgi:hypothetical protein